MTTLNKKATAIFLNIVKFCDTSEEGHVKFQKDNGFMPLSVELLYKTKSYNMYSFAHYYKQNGDLVPDPDMCFLQNRENPSQIYPASFQNAIAYTQAAEIDETGNAIVLSAAQMKDLAIFANIWMSNIYEQQIKGGVRL